MGKTSTFTIHHDRCNPREWTADDILLFARFVQFGDLQTAASLAKKGVQLVLSEHHEPKGGELEHVGWAEPGDEGYVEFLDEVACDDDVTTVVPVYRGPLQYVARVPIGDLNGEFDGYEFELRPTEAEAIKLTETESQ